LLVWAREIFLTREAIRMKTGILIVMILALFAVGTYTEIKLYRLGFSDGVSWQQTIDECYQDRALDEREGAQK